jgi:A/G-specific adenine glycosylase
MLQKVNLSNFSQKILFWNKKSNRRVMPWKGEKDPYKIWLSEIILQQTRVEQGLAYYNRFITKYPTIESLAAASDDEVYKLWEGLGYYSRCRNLISTARLISTSLAGIFPKTYESIISLKGIGPYTAAAIASFAYDLPYAVVDGNVMRVLARFYGIKTPIDSTEGKKYFAHLAQSLIDKKNAGTYNQAIMDFGATICKPALPLCNDCVIREDCIALKKDLIKELPVKQNKLIKRKRYFYYFVAKYKNNFYVGKRSGKDIWQNLWEFPLLEFSSKISVDELLLKEETKKLLKNNINVKEVSPFYIQQLTHQTIEGCFISIDCKKPLDQNDYIKITAKNLNTLAFPRFITNYFEKIGPFK